MKTYNRTFIITGGNAGLGYQCALDIAKICKDDYVVIACRNLERGNIACEELISATGNSNISVMLLDLASFESIRSFCKAFSNSAYPPLYGLVCNAAASFSENLAKTKDGIDMTFGVNHLGHFLLANLLANQISGNGRIVFVASDRHDPYKWLIRDFDYTDAVHLAYPEKYLDEKKQNVGFKYSMSKLCNVYCTYEMAVRIKATGRNITVNAFNPAYMPDTGLNGKTLNPFQRFLNNLTKIPAALLGTLSSVEKSGGLLAAMMTDSKYDSITGKYFDRGKEISSSDQSYNLEKSGNLWNRSIELTNLQQNESIQL